jgi:hypothetical protein
VSKKSLLWLVVNLIDQPTDLFFMKLIFSLFILLIAVPLFSQTTVLRGNVYDEDTGEAIPFCTIQLEEAGLITDTDVNGFFSLSGVPAGRYTLVATYIGYDTTRAAIEVLDQQINYRQLFLTPTAVVLKTVNVSGVQERSQNRATISTVTVTPTQITALPSVGGEADIAQYLPVLPGVISTGEQGGQLYIRGGSAVQNKILLDGMPLYNPFHSIGLFSVFETEALSSVDVLTGGFGAQHGGRISAVVDIKTREGNRKKWSGMASASPFQAKMLVEGPLKQFSRDQGSLSLLLTGKIGYLNQTSKALYDYAVDTSFYAFAAQDTSLGNLQDGIGLPYSYGDFYGKLSFVGNTGSKFNLFGFSFGDRFEVPGLADLEWSNGGGGMNFTLLPAKSTTVINGTLSYSDYLIELRERGGGPRSSGISTYNALMRFTNYGKNKQLDYGFEFNGFNTDFDFINAAGNVFEQRDFTSELNGFIAYSQNFDRLILEPGIRLQYYASQATASIEPRLALKYKVTTDIRFKVAAGQYSQNLISTFNDQDVVNLFVGFLSGPEETIFRPGTREAADNRIQKAWHLIGGLELDVSEAVQLNIEGYYKDFTQLIQINRNKLAARDPDFVIETGDAYGLDISVNYSGTSGLYAYLAYSLAFANRFDGEQEYPPVFDRRHNLNWIGGYTFGEKGEWELSGRWNLGSGFPFTQTQGFYQDIDFQRRSGGVFTEEWGPVALTGCLKTVEVTQCDEYNRRSDQSAGQLILSSTGKYESSHIFLYCFQQ